MNRDIANRCYRWDAIVPAEEERLPNLATQVLVRVRFASNAANDTPALSFKDVNLIGYLNGTAGAYITRENELTQGVASTKVYAQMDIPSGTTIQWFCSNDGGGGRATPNRADLRSQVIA